MNTFQIISLKVLLILSAEKAVDVLEVHALEEDLALDCYISVLVLLITLSELFQVRGYS